MVARSAPQHRNRPPVCPVTHAGQRGGRHDPTKGGKVRLCPPPRRRNPVTRKDSVLAAAESAKETARHASEVVAPYAGTAKDAMAHYAHEMNELLAPKLS